VPGAEDRQGGDRWGILALIIAARVAMTIQLQSVGAVGPLLLADPDFGIGYAGLGALIGAYLLPGLFVALPAAWLTVRLGERRMVLAGLLLAAAGGLAIAAAPGFGTAFAARLVAGAGTALLNVVLSAMLMARFTGPALAPAMGGFLAAYPFAVGLSLVALPALGTAIGWRGAMLVVAAACALTLAAAPFPLARASARTAPAGNTGSDTHTGMLRPGEWGPVLASGLAWVGFNAGAVVLFGFAPALLAERGVSPEAAGALTSLAGWGCVPLLPVAGALAERSGRPLIVAAFSLAATGAMVLALAAGVGPAAAALLAAGLLSSLPAPVIMTLPARALSPETLAAGMGLYWTIYYAGMALLPPVAGWAADATGSGAAALCVSAGFLFAAVACIAAYSALLPRR
jgi:predicted MFS family arabinose efflux permease